MLSLARASGLALLIQPTLSTHHSHLPCLIVAAALTNHNSQRLQLPQLCGMDIAVAKHISSVYNVYKDFSLPLQHSKNMLDPPLLFHSWLWYSISPGVMCQFVAEYTSI